MEQPDIEIKDLEITDIDFKIIYQNDAIEIIEKNKDGYKKLFDAWLIEQPMFISDIYKTQMRDLNFASRGNETSINHLIYKHLYIILILSFFFIYASVD